MKLPLLGTLLVGGLAALDATPVAQTLAILDRLALESLAPVVDALRRSPGAQGEIGRAHV